MGRFRLGDKIKFKSVLRRVGLWNNGVDIRTWRKIPVGPLDGIFLGYRTLSNGVSEYPIHNDEPIIYKPKEYLRVCLIAYNSMVNPQYVMIGDVYENPQLLDGEGEGG